MLRFDEGCMRPADKTFGEARDVVMRVLVTRTVGIAWDPCRTLVLDNWRTLHARDSEPPNEAERVLERVLVSEG
jgi:alpha-ketoglutarate-dependent taurine dioxygenase